MGWYDFQMLVSFWVRCACSKRRSYFLLRTPSIRRPKCWQTDGLGLFRRQWSFRSKCLYRFMPSATRRGTQFMITFKTSLTYKTNHGGPSALLWTTPKVTGLMWEVISFIYSTWFLCKGCDVNHDDIRPVNPLDWSCSSAYDWMLCRKHFSYPNRLLSPIFRR